MILPQSLQQSSVLYWPATLYPAPASPDRAEITIVTAFFDIGRGSWGRKTSEVSDKYRRSVDDYIGHFGHLAPIDNDLVVFTSPDLAERVLEARRRHGQADRTVIFTIDQLFDLVSVRPVLAAIDAQMTSKFRDFVWRPTAPEYNFADYVLINAMKSTFAVTALDFGVVRARQLAWIDFGYAGSADIVDASAPWRFDFGDRINLFAIFAPDDRPIYDIVRRGEVYIQGCHIVGPAAAWPDFNRHMDEALTALIDCNLIDDDQTMLLMAWRKSPDAFTLRRRRIAPQFGWRFIFRQFQGEAAPEDEDLPPVRSKNEPDWYRDMKTYIRRRLRRRWAALTGKHG